MPSLHERAKDIFLGVLSCAAADRAAFVANACGDDEALRQEVESLLAFHDESKSSGVEPAVRAALAWFDHGSMPQVPAYDTDPAQDSADSDDLSPGSRVGHYVILERLGRGGMGQVFLANDPRLRRRVALKRLTVFPANSGDERSRILNEARAAARINHPNVATIHDVLEHDSHAFIVMEYVSGETLGARLRRERLAMDRIVAFGRQLASALGAAHANGIIHRDLKPANVQLTPDGTLKVLDFGVAIVSSGITTTTSAGRAPSAVPALAGTPGYMSPEQMVGHHVDERSDIFSLGVVLFEMCTGRTPYGRGDFLDMIEVMGKPAPRADAIASDVPCALADLIAKAIDVEPRQRFQSALELGSALDALQRELQTSFQTAPTAPRASVAKSRLVPIVSAVLLAPVVATTLGLISTHGLNVTLQRTAPFSYELWYAYPIWGVRSMVAPAVGMIAVLLAITALAFVMRMLNLISAVSRPLTSIRTRTGRLTSRIELEQPAVLSQAMALAALVALALVAWRYQDLIAASMAYISISDPRVLTRLSPDNVNERSSYEIVLSIMILALAYSVRRLIRLRTLGHNGVSAGSVALMCLVIAVLVFLYEAPYRTFHHTKFERIAFGEDRCYITGTRDAEMLIYCPDAAPPRNRIVQRSDPRVRRLGIIESIFSPAAGQGA